MKAMKNRTLLILMMAVIAVAPQLARAQAKPANPAPAKPTSGQPASERPQIDRRKLSLADRPNLTLEDVNTVIGIDKRVIVMMAALNVAGYDYESGGRALSVIRQQLREDLKGIRPELVQRLRYHFQSHRKGQADAAAVAPYLSLALSMTDPPAFTIDVAAERLPEDVRAITDFALLLEEFYRETGFSRLLPKYIDSYIKVAETYGPSAGLALGTVLSVTSIPSRCSSCRHSMFHAESHRSQRRVRRSSRCRFRTVFDSLSSCRICSTRQEPPI